jgi:diguanylate cyclase
MQKAPIPKNEQERLIAVHNLAILDSEPEARFDNITKEVKEKLNVPISTLTIIDKDREWFKSKQGLSKTEGKREVSFCGHALLATEIFIVEDTLKDDRFKDNPMVVGGPHIRFYAGISLRDYITKLPVGVLCVKDIIPRKLKLEEINILMELASRAEKEINNNNA